MEPSSGLPTMWRMYETVKTSLNTQLGGATSTTNNFVDIEAGLAHPALEYDSGSDQSPTMTVTMSKQLVAIQSRTSATINSMLGSKSKTD